MKRNQLALSATAVLLCAAFTALAQDAPTPKLRDEMRMPWTRGSTDFIRGWLVAGPFTCTLDSPCTPTEGNARGAAGAELERADGTKVKWQVQQSWGDVVGLGVEGAADGDFAYAFANVPRPTAGPALLSLGSQDGIRVWVNGKQVHSRNITRSWTPDEDQVEVDLNAGDNALLIKVGASKSFAARVLETGTVLARVSEIGPSILDSRPDGFVILTDATAARSKADAVRIEVIRPGGEVVLSTTANRGDRVNVDASAWADGPYEARLTTRDARGLRYLTHLAWYKGDALAKARELAAAAVAADATKYEGFTLRMLAEMVDDRLGLKLADATGNPWSKIHSALMEYDELMLERAGKPGRVRASGFVRLGWIDEVDGTPQYCRAYLPPDYAASKKWPLVLQLHGFNPPNPVYVRWWSADNRHSGADLGLPGDQGLIYIEPHGRGNTQYIGMGDADVMRCIAAAKRTFSVDDNRVYLTGDSMGGWGTWNVATRHPDTFAAIAPIFGGVDWHSQLNDEEAAALSVPERFMQEKRSSWSMADSLINTPVFVHHGDQDAAVNVEWSRWGVRLMQRWGYDIRYREYPGKIHEALQWNNGTMNLEWFLEHERNPNPRQVRIRSAELRNASAWWARVEQQARPLEFMVVDAEVVDRNVIRLDTQNVLDIVLTPSAALVDPAKPVKVVWNGVAHEVSFRGNTLRLTDKLYKPAALRKTPQRPGGIADFLGTPFAVVTGTISKDPAMNALSAEKAGAFVAAWRQWQKFEPRVFKDTEISDADIAKYSLLLIGGADANHIAARLAPKLPIKVTASRVVIDGKAFEARDAAVQMLYPHPGNAERYIWLVTATSTNGMHRAQPTPFRTYEWDYLIDDGHIPAFKARSSPDRTNVVSGMFDYNWRYAAAHAYPGDPHTRATGRVLRQPVKGLEVNAKLLADYAGKYRLENGQVVELTSDGTKLSAHAGQADDLLPIDESNFYAPMFQTWLNFVRDSSGKVTGVNAFTEGGDFEAKRLD